MKRIIAVTFTSLMLLSVTACTNSDTNSEEPDFKLLEKAVKILDCPVILEGRIWTPEQIKKAFELGAHAVVIGSAVTRPQLIVKRLYSKSQL